MTTTIFEGTLTFSSPISRETSFNNTLLSESAKSEISIKIHEDGTGYAEWEIPELDEYEEIGLSFEGNVLIDYDGVFSLPPELVQYLSIQGYNMTWAE